MAQSYTAVVKQEGPWWYGWIEEIPGVNCQEVTHDDLVVSLREALVEAIEMNRQDAILGLLEVHGDAPECRTNFSFC